MEGLIFGMYFNHAVLCLFQKHSRFILIKFLLYMYMARGL